MYHTRTIALEMPNPTQIRKRSLFLQHVPLCTKGIKYRLKLSNMVVATRRGVVGPCKCGVGRCRICNSSCKRCKCDCDGISPRDALQRGRGRQKGYSKAKRLQQEDMLVQTKGLRRSKRTKIVVGDDDSTWLPVVVKKKVAPKKTFKTIHNSNICIEVPIEKKEGKLLNTLLRNKHKRNTTTTNKSTTGATTVAEDEESNEDNVVEAVPVGDHSTAGNTSNYVPVNEIYIESDEDLSALDSKVLGLPREYRPIRLANDPVINKKNYKEYSSSSDNETNNVSDSKTSTKQEERQNKKKDTLLSPIDNLINFFDLPPHYLYNLPSHKSRKSSDTIRDNHPKRFQKMVTFTMKAFQSVLDVICPGPSQHDVVSSCVGTMLKNSNGYKEMSKSYNNMTESLSLCMKASKHSSTERRVIRALLYKNFTHRQISELMNTYEFKLATGRTRMNAKSDYESLLNEGCLDSKSHKFSK